MFFDLPRYQMDLCKKALEENIIVYLGTGTGKTHIAILLIYEMGHLIKKPQKDKCIFLAPTNALVQQQAKVIETSVDFNVGIYCGRSRRHVRDHNVWEKEIEEYEVLVMTPQFLLYCLCHCFIKIDQIALLVFDECHYAQPESNHPYAEIMKVFYKTDLKKLPRIFGMTASPILRKGGSVDNLEALLHAKVYSVKDEGELKQYVASPKVKVYYYDSIKDGYSCPLMSFARKLDDMKIQCISTLQDKIDQNILRIKLLQRLHANIVFCLVNLGLWGALQATHICLKGEVDSIAELDGEESGSDDICKKYLHEASLVLDNGCTRDGGQVDSSCLEVLKEPFFTRKLLKLFELLSNFRGKQNMKCIIFVNRIVTARMLSNLVQNMAFLSFWRCGFLLGVHSGHVSRRSTNIILEKFRSGELNLLVATKVGEEGLDIQTCCLVIRFDLPETVASFIQSRGRARMPQSEYAFLLERDNLAELNLIDDFKRTETLINEEISTRDSPVPTLEFQEKSPYKVDSTGATISSSYSVSLLHHYCSSLPHDEYFNPEPDFFYFDDEDGMLCNVILPVNAPVSKIVSTIQPTKEAAKKDACLRACQKLHEIGALTDYLLPEQDENCEEWISEFSDCGDGNDEESHELHEMLVPAALRNSFTEDVEDHIYFSSYYIKFSPTPVDRTYRRFGLFVKESLPEEAEKMKLNLSIDNGRMVMTQLIPCGISPFDKDKIDLAEKFQRMFLKIILDRHEFKAEYLSLEDDILETSPLTYYLLLPVLEDENKYSVDWALVKRCLSSPIFKCPRTASGVETCQLNNTLHLANGCWSIDDIMNSLVYVPCRDIFYFISDIWLEKNAHDLHYKDTRNHAEFYAERFDVHLAYPAQPLLKAKQVFLLTNLLRKEKPSGKWREKPEFFVELPPEICELKVLCFSKDIGSSLSLIPSFMHRLESFLVAIELKAKMAESFPEGAKVTTNRILEAITTIRCSEQFSLERLEVLGDAYLKYAIGRYLFLKHDLLDEGQLTKKRSKITSNRNLLNLAKRSNLQVYIRDQTLEPSQFFPFGRPCPVSCNEEAKGRVHSPLNNEKVADIKVRCNKCHHWLHKKTIADFVEALIGAYIVDSGFKAATAFLNWFGIQADILPSQVGNVCRASNAFVPLIDKIDVEVLENNLGYKFTHKGLLIQAFVHPSFKHNSGGCYQRLEFLGDAVLDYMITSYLYSVYPNLDPGHLTDLRSLSVNNMMLADVSVRRSFHKFIVCDSGDLRKAVSKYANLKSLESTERCTEEKTCPKVLGDVLESCVGALFLDAGLDLNHLWKIMLQLLDPVVNKSELQLNPLRNLKELSAFYKWDLQFSKVKKDGKFCVEAKVNGEAASATNKNGKAAGRNAAGQLFERLTTQGYKSSAKSLREVLDESEEMEAMLIGYDEPSHTFTSIVQELLEASQNDCKTEVYPLSESSSIIRAPPRNGCGNPSNINCIAYGKSAKSRLYELCTAKQWKLPVFECCRQTGQDHSTEFTFKGAMEIEPNVAFEFIGMPLPTKKQAAEAAAKSAIWYFTKEGHMNYCI